MGLEGVTSKRQVGVVGLGAMGQGVARNLIRAGFGVHGCDVREEARAALAADGGQPCATPAEVGSGCDALIVLVVNERQVEHVLFGASGAASAMQPGSVVIACATGSPASAANLGSRLKELGVLMLDAPVTGGVKGAAEGTLTMLTSGPAEAYDACEDVLAAIADRVYRFGPEHGLGSKVKIINQLLVGVHIAAAAEALALGMHQGVDVRLLYEAIRHGAGNSWAFTDRGERMVSAQFERETALDIFTKDLGLVLDTARDAVFPTPLASTAFQMFASASASGLGNEDDSALIKLFPLREFASSRIR